MQTTTQKLPDHLSEFEGDLYDNRKPFAAGVVRKRYKYQFGRIETLSQVKATLRAGSVTWPGCYPLYFITQDGGALCFDCARKEFRQVVWDFLHKASTGWRIAACDVNWESLLHCDHCSKEIESAYGHNDEEEKE